MAIKTALKSKMFCSDKRVLIFSEKLGPSYYLSCHLPLLRLQKEIEFSFYTVDTAAVENNNSIENFHSSLQLIKDLKPQIVIFARTYGVWINLLVESLKKLNIKSVYFLDDNFFSLPNSNDLDVKKRVATIKDCASSVSDIIRSVDFVWCSTEVLKKEILQLGLNNNFVDLIYPTYFCRNWSKKKLEKLLKSKKVTIGYYGSYLHRDDLEAIAPELDAILRDHPEVNFEVFGNLVIPEHLKNYHNRVFHKKTVGSYLSFRKELENTDWILSLAPLNNNKFNLSRSPIKFLESTAAGIPFLCSNIEVYNKYVESANGLVVNDGMWYHEISKCLSNREILLKQLSDAHEYCLNNFGQHIVSSSYKSFFKNFLGSERVRYRNVMWSKINSSFSPGFD